MGGIKIISLILNERLNEQFLNVIKKFNMEVELNIYKKIDFSKEVIRISQKKSEYSVIDFELVEDKDRFVEELRNLRINSNDLNLIILMRNKKPGSLIVKKIVNLGIYNIIFKNDSSEIINEFSNILQGNNKTYRDVSMFDCEVEDEVINEKNVTEYVHHLGSKIISCLGSESGSGTTHTLIMFANYLSRNHRVAYIEMNNSYAIKALGKITNRLTLGKKYFNHQKVDYYWDVDFSTFINSNKNKYEYLLIDFGVSQNIKSFDYFLLSDIKLCTISGIDWRIENSKNTYDYLSKIDVKNKWLYLVPFIEKKYLKELNVYIKNEIITIPYNVNPFKPEKCVMEKFDMLLHINNERSIVKKLWRGAKDGIW